MSGLVGDVTPVIHQSKTMDLDAVHHSARTEDQPGKTFN